MNTPCRVTVFATWKVGRRVVGVAWDEWNDDPRMEQEQARLSGSGSFYWPGVRAAYRHVVVALRKPGANQAKVETISGGPVARLYASGGAVRGYALIRGEE